MPIHLLVEGRLPAEGRDPLTFYRVIWVEADGVDAAKARAASWLRLSGEEYLGIDEEETRAIPEERLSASQREELARTGVVAMSGRIFALE